MQEFKIPTLHDRPKDFDQIFDLASRILESDSIEIDFSGCDSLMQNAVAILGGLAKLVEHNGGSLEFRWDTLSDEVRRSLHRNNFLDFFGQDPYSRPRRRRSNAVPFRQDLEPNENSIIQYLHHNWIGSGRMHLSSLLGDHIVATVWEIYANAFEHSASPVGIFTCGQYYPQKRVLKLTVVDFGVGIPHRVRTHFGKRMNAAEAMKWAFERGNSTKADAAGMARGLGLDILREFVRLNRGTLEIFSYDGYARIDRMQRFGPRFPSFLGTVVNITFSCDESYYRFESEPEDARLF